MLKKLEITLPWPSANVGLNGRMNHFAKNAAFQGYKSKAYWLTKEALKGKFPHPSGLVCLQYTPYCPQTRRRDEDNLFGLLKAAQDGIAQAMKVDDYFFHLLPIVRHEEGDCSYFKDPKKNGFVVVAISWSDNA